jgi:hypothetical protein
MCLSYRRRYGRTLYYNVCILLGAAVFLRGKHREQGLAARYNAVALIGGV